MSNSLKIIDRVRKLTETGTDYAVAKALGMTQSNLKTVIDGRGHLGPRGIFQAAELLKLDARELMALVNEDKAKTQSDRAYWRSLCPESVREALAGATTAALILSGVFAGFSLSTAHAASFATETAASLQCILW